MTVQELISKLQAYDPDDEIMFAYQYGDHWRTTVAKPVRKVDEDMVQESEGAFRVVDFDESTDEEKCKQVVIIS